MRKHPGFALHRHNCHLHMDFRFLLSLLLMDHHIVHRFLRKRSIALYVYCFTQLTLWHIMRFIRASTYTEHYGGTKAYMQWGLWPSRESLIMWQNEYAFFSPCGGFSFRVKLQPHSQRPGIPVAIHLLQFLPNLSLESLWSHLHQHPVWPHHSLTVTAWFLVCKLPVPQRERQGLPSLAQYLQAWLSS